jgi:DNA-binding NarL/FixJ family response regulator
MILANTICTRAAGFSARNIHEGQFIVKVPTLLLVDDNPAVLEMLVEMLKPHYGVIVALTTGTSALEQITSISPDIILLDISLGDISGYEVARRLMDRPSVVKIIFLSLHEDIEFVNAGFNVGACGYVFKSRVRQDLIKAINSVFSGLRFVPECGVHPSEPVATARLL